MSTANLTSVSLAGLFAGQTDATNKLVSSCKTNGFFYLDFRHPSTCDILELVDRLAAIGKSVFKLSLSEKEEYSTEKYLPSRLLGYKRAGCSVGPFAGKKDGYESFSIHNNGIFGDDDMIVPQEIENNLALFKMFMSEVHGYTECILSILSKALSLPYDLSECHRKDEPSSANMAMLNYLPYGNSHRGLLKVRWLTKLCYLGVKIGRSYPLETGMPLSMSVDSLRFLSGGKLASSLHRVVPPPDASGQDKFSVIYFLRPEFDAKFKTSDGQEISSVEWHNRKYQLFREDTLDAREHGNILTGRAEYLGVTEG